MSSAKTLVTWTARDAIQEAREACGGHGYLKASNLGELRNNHDASVTYEGDNNVLGQQASNWLLRQWNGDRVESPIGSASFVSDRDKILLKKFVGSGKVDGVTCKLNSIARPLTSLLINSFDLFLFLVVIDCYQWLMCWLLDATAKCTASSLSKGSHRFEARNNAQVYKARNLTRAYSEFYALECFRRKCLETEQNEFTTVLHSIYMIYGLWSIDKHMATFYQGGYANGNEFADYVRAELLRYCAEIKDSSISVADALAPPDFVLNSVIGKSDGRVS